MKPNNKFKITATKFFLNIYELSDVLKSEIKTFQIFKKEKIQNKQSFTKNEKIK